MKLDINPTEYQTLTESEISKVLDLFPDGFEVTSVSKSNDPIFGTRINFKFIPNKSEFELEDKNVKIATNKGISTGYLNVCKESGILQTENGESSTEIQYSRCFHFEGIKIRESQCKTWCMPSLSELIDSAIYGNYSYDTEINSLGISEVLTEFAKAFIFKKE